jgi:cyclopropane fatty-acyl-phospholipid synthase-like methyltransferase
MSSYPLSADGWNLKEDVSMSKTSSLHKEHQEAIGPAERCEGEKVPRMFEPAARFLFKHVPLQPRNRLLDVACGFGIVTRLVADQAGSDGSIIGLDIDPVTDIDKKFSIR